MATCRTCQHFAPNASPRWCGTCAIRLPAWVERQLEFPNDRFVRADDGCDLHQAKEVTA